MLQLKSPGQFCHLVLGKGLALLGGLLHGGQDNFLKELDVVRVDDFLVDFDRDDVTGTICSYFHFAAARAHFDSVLLEFGLSPGHLLLHLLGLLHELVEVHKIRISLFVIPSGSPAKP